MHDDSDRSSGNAFERDKPGTNARTIIESRIEALRKRGGIFVDAVSATRMPMALTDPTLPGNPIVFANQSFLNLSGYSMDEVLGQQPHFMNGHDTNLEDAAKFIRILAGDEDGVVETVQYAKNGRRFVATVLLSAFKDETGRTIHHFLSWADVTAQVDAENDASNLRKTQASLRESEQRLQSVLESIGDAFYALDREQRFLFVSDAALTMWGRRREDVIGRIFLDAFPEATGSPSYEAQLRVLEGRRSERLEVRSSVIGRWVEVDIRPADNGGLSVAFRDIQDRKAADDRLRESEERFAEFAASSTDAIWIRNAQTYAFQFVSPAVRGVYGVTPEAVMADAELLHNLIVPEDRETTAANIARVAAGKVIAQEYRIQRPTDPAIRWIRSTGFPFRNSDGRIERIGAIAQDVTEQKLADAALRENEERLRLAIEIGALASWDWDLETGQIKWSDRHYLLQGYDVGEVTPSLEAWLARVHPEDRAKAIELIGTARDEKTTYIHEFRSWQPDGAIVWCSARGRFFYDRDGKPIRMIGVMEDITDRKRAQEALRESEARHRYLIGTWAQAVWETDADGVVVTDSPSWRAHTGQTLDEWLGYGWLDAVQPDDQAYAERQWRNAIASGSLVNAEFRLRAPDGGWRWTNVRAAPVLDEEGNISKWAAMNIDIDARKRAETSLRDNEDRQAFMLNLSDGLRAQNDDPYAIGSLATKMLAEHLGVERCYIVNLSSAEGVARVETEYCATGLQSLRGDHRYADFPDTMRRLQSGTLTVSDIDSDQTATDVDRLSLNAIGMRAIIAAFHGPDESGEVWGIAAGGRAPRHWKEEDARLVGDVAERTLAAIERARAEAALRESEERLRLIVESARDYAIFTTDRERRITSWLPGAQAVFGWSREEIERRLSDVLFTPEDRQEGVPEAEAETALRDGEAPDIRWHLRQDGHRVFIEGQVVPLFEGGIHTGFLKIGQDVTSRRAGEKALRESEERLRQFGEASQDVIWIRDPTTLDWTYLTPAFEAIYGLSRQEAMSGDNFNNWLDMILPEDRDQAAASIHKVRQGERVTFEYRIRRRHDGHIRWLRDTDFPIFNEVGHVTRIGGIGQDVTEDKKAAERMAVLVAELQHRTRNLIAVVRSMAEKTLRGASSLENFREGFRDRLLALARVQGLLSRLDESDRVIFDELIESELKALGATENASERVTLSGPTGIRLRSSTVQTLAMALHELATNASKYGALSQPTGQLHVSWRLEPEGDGGEPWLHIEWRESGVSMPEPGAKATGSGQGRELIERALPYQLQARTSYELGEEGVRCTISIPVSASNSPKGEDYA